MTIVKSCLHCCYAGTPECVRHPVLASPLANHVSAVDRDVRAGTLAVRLQTTCRFHFSFYCVQQNQKKGDPEMLKAFKNVISEPTSGRWTGSFIFMHGSGATGHDLHDDIKEGLRYDFNFPHIKVIYPTAPLQPYTLLGGALSNVWFDRTGLRPKGTECLSSIDHMALQLKKMVQEEVDAGVPENRIIIGGFSMGASMALHLGLRFLPNVAGIVSLSTFLYNTSEIYKVLENDKSVRRPPVLMSHGDEDDLISLRWGKQTYEHLSKLGIDATFKTIPDLGHSLTTEELDIVKSWVMEKVPDS